MRSEKGRGVGSGTDDVDERVADERDRHAGLPIERLLEREDHDHPVDGLADRAHAAAAPRPHLGRDVVDDRDPPALQLAREAQVEVGIVDQNGEVGPLGVGTSEQVAEDRPDPRQVSQHLQEADDGEVADVGDEPAALGLQAVASQPERLDVDADLAQVAYELGRVEIARRLAARDEKARPRARVGRSGSAGRGGHDGAV